MKYVWILVGGAAWNAMVVIGFAALGWYVASALWSALCIAATVFWVKVVRS